MSPAAASWGTRIAVEPIRGIPFRMYAERPRRIEHLLHFADRWGNRPYVVQGERRITFAELRPLVVGKAWEIARLGIAPGDRVFILGWNSPAWAVNYWACLLAGAVPAVANAWWSEGELVDAMDLLQPALTLADARGAAKVPAGRARGRWEVDSDLAPVPTAAPAPDAGEEDPAVIIFTSGTEGRAKAVALSHRAVLANLQMLLHITRRLPQQVDETTGETALHTGPLFHVGGPQVLVRSIMVGDTLVLPSGRFDPAEALALIERHGITRWSAVPTMLSRVLDHPDLKRRNVTSLRSVTLGGAPVHAELLQRIAAGLPSVHARIPTGYGLTENGGQATAASGADVEATPGSCGRPLPLTELKFLARPGLPDAEILIRAPTQMSGYVGIDSSPIDAEGWLHTGDLGRLDERGQLFITGRCKELIIRGGENIAPAAVERALMAIPGVAEAAVFGVPHPDLGEEVMAVVVVQGALAQEQLQAQLRTSLASFAVPTRWSIRTEPLPVNLTGKVDKVALKAQARAQPAQATLA